MSCISCPADLPLEWDSKLFTFYLVYTPISYSYSLYAYASLNQGGK